MRRAVGLAAVAAAVLGAVAGAVTMAGLQGTGPGSPPEAPPPRETGREPAPGTPLVAVPGVLLAWTPNGLHPGLDPAARALPTVTQTSVVRGDVADLTGSRTAEGAVVDAVPPGWAIPLDAVALEPGRHAAFVPVADRAAVAGLADGRVLLSQTSARLRRLAPGATVEVAGRSLAVAAVVDDTAIGGAELATTVPTGEQIGVRTERYLLVAHEGQRPPVERALRAARTAGQPIRFRGPGETPFLRHGDAVLTQAQLKDRFGEFTYRRGPPDERGFTQDPAWQAQHLVSVPVPILGEVRCHRAIVEALGGALAEVESAGLAGLVDPAGFAGCWNPRFVRPGPGAAVSHHAWGVAFDLNYGDNPTGTESVQDPRLVGIFDRWGFTEGSRWLVPDAGHFEYAGPAV